MKSLWLEGGNSDVSPIKQYLFLGGESLEQVLQGPGRGVTLSVVAPPTGRGALWGEKRAG